MIEFTRHDLVFVDYLNQASSQMLDIQTKKLWVDSFETVKGEMAKIQDRLDQLDAEADDDID